MNEFTWLYPVAGVIIGILGAATVEWILDRGQKKAFRKLVEELPVIDPEMPPRSLVKAELEWSHPSVDFIIDRPTIYRMHCRACKEFSPTTPYRRDAELIVSAHNAARHPDE